MCDEGYHELAKAIILRAIKDFEPAYLWLKKHPEDEWAGKRVREITEFFCSEYFCLLSEMDGPRLLKQVIHKLDTKGKLK